MNILFVTQADPFYIKFFFKTFFERYGKKENIKGIVIQDTLNQKTLSSIIRKALSFYGPYGFLCMSFRYAGIKVADILSKLTNIQLDASIAQISRRYGIPILPFKSVNSEEFHSFIVKENVELIISVAASEIFRKEVLDLPKFGCINSHSAPLPKYRGMMPNFWMLYNNEKNAWVTVHKMVKGLDEGQIILRDKFEIMPNESFNSLAKRSKEFAAEVILKVLEQFEDGTVKYLPNDTTEATYYTFPSREDMMEFKRKGGRII